MKIKLSVGIFIDDIQLIRFSFIWQQSDFHIAIIMGQCQT